MKSLVNIAVLLVIGLGIRLALAQPAPDLPQIPNEGSVAEVRGKLAAGELVELRGGDLVVRETLVLSRSAGGGLLGRVGGKVVGGGWIGTPGTRIVWGGPEGGGPVVQVDRSIDAVIADLAIAGERRAAVGVLVSSAPGWGSGNLSFERVTISGCGVAIEAGQNPGDINCADIVYDRVRFIDCAVGLRTNNDQSVNHHFRSLVARDVGVVFDFVRGGQLVVEGGDVGSFDWYLRVWRGGANAAKFRSSGVRFELDGWSKRHACLVDAGGLRDYDLADIAFVDCAEAAGPLSGAKTDNGADPLFVVGRGATVTTQRHIHSGRPVARVTAGSYRDEQSRWVYTAPGANRNWQRSGEGRIRVIDPSDVFGNAVEGVNRK